jgi:hypothetical protein
MRNKCGRFSGLSRFVDFIWDSFIFRHFYFIFRFAFVGVSYFQGFEIYIGE